MIAWEAFIASSGSASPRTDLPRVLIIDHDVEAANAVASLVETSGHGEARVAHSGQAALAMAAAFLPTVVLLKLDLPDMSGYDVARQLSQYPRLQNPRLIALTGSSEHPGRDRAREAGVERYLIAPPGAAELEELFA